MRTGKFFARHFMITSGIVLGSVALGILVMHIVASYRMQEQQQEHQRFRMATHPALFYARLLDQLNPGHRERAAERIAEMSGDSSPLRFTLLDKEGKPLTPEPLPEDFDWQKVKKPAEPYESEELTEERHPGPPRSILVRLPGEPAQYFLSTFDDHGFFAPLHADRPPMGGPPGGLGSPPPFFYAAFGSLAVSILLGVGFALLLLFRGLQKRVRLADSVIAELRGGNLRARFPITKMDEIGEVMSRFNAMAEEIERLVEQLRKSENARMKLLQELAHDLRTPVASLKNLVETGSKDSVSSEQKRELQALALREIDYFERLVEDLLVLAQVNEPRYTVKAQRVSLNGLLEDEMDGIRTRADSGEKALRIVAELPADSLAVAGDEHLIRRMLRNALENAASFAKSSVRVSVSREGGEKLRIVIADDGPGFPSEVLKNYGERRVSRTIGGSAGGRVSVGLGSVIIKTVARIHGGEVVASNAHKGAELAITLRV